LDDEVVGDRRREAHNRSIVYVQDRQVIRHRDARRVWHVGHNHMMVVWKPRVLTDTLIWTSESSQLSFLPRAGVDDEPRLGWGANEAGAPNVAQMERPSGRATPDGTRGKETARVRQGARFAPPFELWLEPP
jgi:hypothetical protein